MSWTNPFKKTAPQETITRETIHEVVIPPSKKPRPLYLEQNVLDPIDSNTESEDNLSTEITGSFPSLTPTSSLPSSFQPSITHTPTSRKRRNTSKKTPGPLVSSLLSLRRMQQIAVKENSLSDIQRQSQEVPDPIFVRFTSSRVVYGVTIIEVQGNETTYDVIVPINFVQHLPSEPGVLLRINPRG
ncbi:hypothetical protein GEMRC1_012850 [Eukaryota sp. GEM-RC1]